MWACVCLGMPLFGLILSKLFFIHCLLLLQKCEFLLLKVYDHLESNIFPNIPHENYVSNNKKPSVQATMMLRNLDKGTCGICDPKTLGGRAWATLSSPWISAGFDGNPQKTDIELYQNSPIDCYWCIFHQVRKASQYLAKLRKLDIIKKKLIKENYCKVKDFKEAMDKFFQDPRVSGSHAFVSFSFHESLCPHFLVLGIF